MQESKGLYGHLAQLSSMILAFYAISFVMGRLSAEYYLDTFGAAWIVPSISVISLSLGDAKSVLHLILAGSLGYGVSVIMGRGMVYQLCSIAFYILVLCWMAISVTSGAEVIFSDRARLELANAYKDVSSAASIGIMAFGFSVGALIRRVGGGNQLSHMEGVVFAIFAVGTLYFGSQLLGLSKSIEVKSTGGARLPLVVSGDYVGWRLLGLYDSKAVLANLGSDLDQAKNVAVEDVTKLVFDVGGGSSIRSVKANN